MTSQPLYSSHTSVPSSWSSMNDVTSAVLFSHQCSIIVIQHEWRHIRTGLEALRFEDTLDLGSLLAAAAATGHVTTIAVSPSQCACAVFWPAMTERLDEGPNAGAGACLRHRGRRKARLRRRENQVAVGEADGLLRGRGRGQVRGRWNIESSF